MKVQNLQQLMLFLEKENKETVSVTDKGRERPPLHIPVLCLRL